MVSLLRLGLLVLAVLGASGCGGKASSSVPDMTAGAGGVAAAGEPFRLDDAFPWFNSNGDAKFPSGDKDEILQIVARATPARFTLSTHNLFDMLSYSKAVEFSARASAPTHLRVSASRRVPGYDYFAARDAGEQWPLAAVEVGLEWQDFSVLLAEMQPSEMADDDGVPSFFLAFIVDHPEPIDVWLDDVSFR